MLILDSTQMKTWCNCPKKYLYQYVECLRKNEYEEDSVDLRFGSAIHSGLELVDAQTTDIQPAVDKFSSEFLDLPGEELKTLQHGQLLLKEFLPYFQANFRGWETLQLEETDTVKVGETDYTVKVDRVIKWNGNIYVVDWKTAKVTYKSRFFDKFTLDFQPSGYIKWCVEKYGSCSGFIPVGLFMGHRKRMYKGEPAGFHCAFDYSIVNRTEEDLADWEADVQEVVREIREAKRTGVWRRNTDHCSGYRGCSCRAICESNGDEMVKEALYHKFNPNEYLGL